MRTYGFNNPRELEVGQKLQQKLSSPRGLRISPSELVYSNRQSMEDTGLVDAKSKRRGRIPTRPVIASNSESRA
jgi:hypothetical protein